MSIVETRTTLVLVVLAAGLSVASCSDAAHSDSTEDPHASLRTPAATRGTPGQETDPIAALSEAMDGAGSRSAATPPAPATTGSSSGPVAYDVPDGFVAETPSSGMRLAQFRLPGDAAGDASLVLYYFGPASAGSTRANLDRWIGQMKQADGGSSVDRARTDSWTNDAGLAVSLVDVEGTYAAGAMPGMAESPTGGEGQRMIAAVVETPQGAVYFKAVGPEATVDRWEDDLLSMLRSARAP